MDRRLDRKFHTAQLFAIAFLFAGAMNWSCALGECKLLLLANLPVTVSNNRALIDGEINGQKIRILVDTGSAYTTIWRSEAVRLGLPLEDVRGTRIFGVGGETRVQSTKTEEFKLGQVVTHGVKFLVIGEGQNNTFSMLLGEDFLSKLTIEFDLAHGAMRLFRAESCKTEQLMYWSPTYSAATLESPPTHTLKVETAVELNGKRVIATWDSGATHSVVSPGAVAHAGIRGEDAEVQETYTGAGIGRRELRFTVAKFDSIAIGDEKVQNLRLQVSELTQNMRVGVTGSRVSAPLQGAPHMLIGADFFLSHRIIIPPNGPAIPFTYAGGPVFQATHNVAPEAGDSTSTDIQSTGAAAKPEGGAR
jgi:clan AA aspartic protease (TIGR02281 family)